MRIICIYPFVVKFSNVDFFEQNPHFKTPLVGIPASLAFKLENILVEYPIIFLVSMPDRFKTIIIHLDIGKVKTGPCPCFTKLNRSCEYFPCIYFVLSRYKSIIHCQTHRLWFSLNMKLDRISRFRSLGWFCILYKMKSITR